MAVVMEAVTVNTVGYEGITLETFLRRLRDRQIELIIDVRANPISRKRGFSKTALSMALSSIGTSYIHFPGLGIPSAIRHQYTDPQELFRFYKEEILPEHPEEEEKVAQLCRESNAALLCFEADPRDCHRLRLAEDLRKFGLAPYHIQ